MSELLPCPHCDNTDKLYIRTSSGSGNFYMFCGYCGDVTPLYESLADLESDWNDRTPEPFLSSENQRLKQKLEDTQAALRRLQIILAVESGDEASAPDGWFLVCRGCWSTNNYDGSIQREDEIGKEQWRAFRDGVTIGRFPNALEAMGAADRASLLMTQT